VDLTIRDRIRCITHVVADEGVHLGTEGRTRARFLGATTLVREQFGLSWNQALDTDGLVLEHTITVALAIEAMQPSRDDNGNVDPDATRG